MAAHRVRVPLPSVAAGDEQTLPAQRVDHLDAVVGITAGAGGERVGQAARTVLIQPQHLCEQRAQVGRWQVHQPDPLRPRPVQRQPGQQGGERMGRVDLGLPVRADQQESPDLRIGENRVDQADLGGTRPLQVVEDQHQRPFRRGDDAQHVEPDPYQSSRDGHRVRWRQVRQHVHQHGELRHDRRGQAGVGAQRVVQPLPQGRRGLLRFGQEQAAEGAQGLAYRVGAQFSPVLVAFAGHQPAAAPGHVRPQLVDQAGLADPGSAADQHAMAPAGHHLVEGAPQPGDLGVPADWPRRRSQPDREVPFTEREDGRPGVAQAVTQPQQVMDETVGALVPLVRFLRQQPQHDVRQQPWHQGVHLGRWHRHAGQVVVGQPQRVTGPERRPAGQRLVQRGTEPVQVRTVVDRPGGAPGLLRRQIRQRAHDLVLVSEGRPFLGEGRRQVEIDQRRTAWRSGQHHVRRGDVPVHDTPAVHGGEDAGEVHGEVHGLQRIERSRGENHIEADTGRVRKHDGLVTVVAHQLGYARDAGQPLQDRPFVTVPPRRLDAGSLLADHRPGVRSHPGHPRAVALVQQLLGGIDSRGPTRRHPPPPKPVR